MDIVGVAWAGDQKSYETFIGNHSLTFPQAIDEAGELYQHFGVPGQPAWVFVDRTGKVTRNLGAMEKDDLTKVLNGLLA